VTIQFKEKYKMIIEENLKEGKVELECVMTGTSEVPLKIK
jgi:hypothetical protein